jgi:hypothetical protein
MAAMAQSTNADVPDLPVADAEAGVIDPITGAPIAAPAGVSSAPMALRSPAQFALQAGTVVSQNTSHRVRLANDIKGTAELVTFSGDRLKSTIYGLAYIDLQSGKSALIAEATSSVGELVSPTRVIYRGALEGDGVLCDVAYDVSLNSFEQCVIVRKRIPPPSEFGMPDSCRLAVLTAFNECPTPRKLPRTINLRSQNSALGVQGEQAMEDCTLVFGSMRMVAGKAWSLGAADQTVPVAKTWQQFPGSTAWWLIESAPWSLLKPQLDALPTASYNPGGGNARSIETALRNRAPFSPGELCTDPIQVASVDTSSEPGVVLDYLLVNSHLINVNLGGAAPEKVGFAAVGQTENDFWNTYYFPNSSSHTLPLYWSDDSERLSPVSSITVNNAQGISGNGSADPMFNSFIYPWYGGNITITITGLPADRYHFYVYGHENTQDANTVCELLRDGVRVGYKGTTLWGTPWTNLNWEEGEHYVTFRDIDVNNQTMTIVVHPGANGWAEVNGLQIAPSDDVQETRAQLYQLLNINFSNGSPKTGPAAIGQAPDDAWNQFNFPWDSDATLPSLSWAHPGQGPASASIRVQNAAGYWGNNTGDPMYDTFVYPQSWGDMIATISSLPAGNYDFYLYGHASDDFQNSVFHLTSGSTSYGSKGTTIWGSGWNSGTVWEEGQQYVVFRNVAVSSGQPVVIDIPPNGAGYALFNGMQIAVPLDRDGNGLPDWWEQQYFGHTGVEPSADPDNDCFTNLQESQNGTNPLVPDGPIITSQPQTQTTAAGGSVTFSVAAEGCAPLSYYWLHNGTLLGADSASLTINNVQASDAGTYRASVVNSLGGTLSDNATLAVLPAAPVITTQPLSQSVMEGDTVTFTVAATGTEPMTYQWKFEDRWGAEAVDVPGANGPSLTIAAVNWPEGTYSVLVQSAAGSTTSSGASLSILPVRGDYAFPLVGPRQDCTLRGDRCYVVDSPVQLYGTTRIEGGTIVKYTTNTGAKLTFNGPVQWTSSPYRPSIFTAAEDDSIGPWIDSLENMPRTPSGTYADVALEFNSTVGVGITNARISYAATAVRFVGSITQEVTDIVRHVQITHCGTAFRSQGRPVPPRYHRLLDLGNVLAADITGIVVSGSYFGGAAVNLTADHCGMLASEDALGGLGFSVQNSILATVTSLFQGRLGLTGDHNGFYATPQFGTDNTSDNQPPFAPITQMVDGVECYNAENGQGHYYLREQSPFVDAGTDQIDPVLMRDLAARTTTVPPPYFWSDITTSQTIGQAANRDNNTPDCGWHYPAVDWVITGVTVNNCTLNIDQGTVLAFVGYPASRTSDPRYEHPWEWGIRINAGGRLNVNGVPTNRVVFARLENLQESPILDMQALSGGPCIAFKSFMLSGVPVTPLPEARFHYADFPNIVPNVSYPWWAMFTFGPWPNGLDPDPGFPMIGQLELEGCHFEGGTLWYDEGGPQGRVANFHNNVFEEVELNISDTGDYSGPRNYPAYDAQITAANNLFYHSTLWLKPLPNGGAGGGAEGATWTFIDNIFDNVKFGMPGGLGYYDNGPVGLNRNNAYIGMSKNGPGGKLAPDTYAATYKVLDSVPYAAGALGRFYLPSTATALLGQGSRSAGLAGLWHFTSLTSNQKQAAQSQVNIGPAYLALDSNGNPVDSNSDGIADFIADRNGDGTQDADEMPWSSANTGSLAILSPLPNSTVSGIVEMRVFLPSGSSMINELYLLVDGRGTRGATAISRPAGSCGSIEVDTTYLEDDQHIFQVASFSSAAEQGTQNQFSAPVRLTTANPARHPQWQCQAARKVNVNVQVPSSLPYYTLWFLSSGYPKLANPSSAVVSQASGIAPVGAVSYSATPADLGYGDGATDPVIYSLTQLADGPSSPTARTLVNPNTRQDLPWPNDPGAWVAAYADNAINYQSDVGYPIADVRSGVVNPMTGATMNLWLHEWMLDFGWRTCGPFASAGATWLLDLDPIDPDEPSTWPVRMNDKVVPHNRIDRTVLMQFLAHPGARNFYGHSHGSANNFFGWYTEAYERRIQHRYRFVFLDGCSTALGSLYCAFGADDRELTWPVYPPSDAVLVTTDWNYYALESGLRPAAFMGWKADVFYKYHVPPPGAVDERTGLGGCPFKCYEAICNWHTQFLFSWIFNRPLLEAVDYANVHAMSSSASPPLNQDLKTFIPTSNGATTFDTFLPATCLRIYGYGSLKFNDYNYYAQWPPP